MDEQKIKDMFTAMRSKSEFLLIREVPKECSGESVSITLNCASENSQGSHVCETGSKDKLYTLVSKPQVDCESFANDTLSSLVEPLVKFMEERQYPEDILHKLQYIYENILLPLANDASSGSYDKCMKLSEFATSFLDIIRRHNILGPGSDPSQELDNLLATDQCFQGFQAETADMERKLMNENDLCKELVVNPLADDTNMQWMEEEPAEERANESVQMLLNLNPDAFNKHGGSLTTYFPPLATNVSMFNATPDTAEMEAECSMLPSSNSTSARHPICDKHDLSCSTENKIPLTVEELADQRDDDDDDGGGNHRLPNRAHRANLAHHGRVRKCVAKYLKRKQTEHQ